MRTGPRSGFPPQDLFAIARDNPIANNYLRAWMAGGFDSFEAMAVELAVALARSNEELRTLAIQAMETRTTILVPASPQRQGEIEL